MTQKGRVFLISETEVTMFASSRFSKTYVPAVRFSMASFNVNVISLGVREYAGDVRFKIAQ